MICWRLSRRCSATDRIVSSIFFFLCFLFVTICFYLYLGQPLKKRILISMGPSWLNKGLNTNKTVGIKCCCWYVTVGDYACSSYLERGSPNSKRGIYFKRNIPWWGVEQQCNCSSDANKCLNNRNKSSFCCCSPCFSNTKNTQHLQHKKGPKQFQSTTK